MGYTTYFEGEFNLDKPLDEETYEFLKKLAETRRMARNVGPEYGVEGEFYVDGSGDFGQGQDNNIIDHNRPPKTQPGLWCQWIPTEDRTGIEWDGGEKFYDYVEWIEYIIDNVLKPRGYTLNGEVKYQGENDDDFGVIEVQNNVVSDRVGKKIYPYLSIAKSKTPMLDSELNDLVHELADKLEEYVTEVDRYALNDRMTALLQEFGVQIEED